MRILSSETIFNVEIAVSPGTNVIKEQEEMVRRLRVNQIPFHMVELGQPVDKSKPHSWQLTIPIDFKERVLAAFPDPVMQLPAPGEDSGMSL